MDEMDFIMHSASDPPLSSAHHHHSQPQGCPYFRSDHGHPTSLPNQHSQYSHPQVHAHAHSAFLLSSNNRAVANPRSRPHQHAHQHPQHAPHTHSHSHYDPVHAASGANGSSANTWYSPPANAPFQWPAPVPTPLAPHPHSNPQLPHSRPGPGPGASSEPYFAGVGGGSAPAPNAGAPGVGPGPIQPGLLQSQHQLSPHHDPFGPYAFATYRHQQPPMSTHHLRFTPGGQASQSQSNSHTSHHSQPPQHQPNQPNPTTQQPQQPQQASQPPSQLSQSGDRSVQPRPAAATAAAAAAPRISLPALNPFPNPAQAPPPTMSNTSSGESSPAAPPASRTSLFASPDDSPRASQNHTNGSGGGPSSSSLSGVPQPHRLVFFNGSEASRAEAGPSTVSDADPLFPGSTPPVPPNTERRRGFSARLRLGRGAPPSDYDDSDEDPDMIDSESEAINFLEQFAVANPAFRDRGDEEYRIRAHQILRGQMTNKRVASKKALSQLQSVDLSTLDENERTCVICYNEFGVPNPEGINEAALRLPNCKHIFGDHCIKKWFEESDSCPYCRDKVHSELAISAHSRAIAAFMENYNRARLASGREPRPPPNAGEPYVRIIPTPAEPRYDSSPPRAWQTGERRSPPSSDGMEPRRRTRPRHGSFRGSPSTSTANSRPAHHVGVNSAVPLQQSAARERFIPSSSNPRPYGYTTAMSRLPVMPPMQQQVEPLGLTPSSIHPAPTPMGMGFGALLSPVDDHARYSMPLNGGTGASSSELGHFPGPAQMGAYTPLPPMGALEGPSYVSASNAVNNHSNPTEPWLQ